METVNFYMIDSLLDPIGGGADNDELTEQYREFDSNDEQKVKAVIAETIKPSYEKLPVAYKTAAKRSLAYYLTTDKLDFGRLYDSCLIAFDHPAIAKDFFIWMWEVLFPGETYIIKNVAAYREVEDVDEPRRYFL